MRITLTLDPDVARLVKDAVHRQRRPTKQVINDALRQALRTTFSDIEPYCVEVHDSALLTGIDPAGLNRLADELDDATV